MFDITRRPDGKFTLWTRSPRYWPGWSDEPIRYPGCNPDDWGRSPAEAGYDPPTVWTIVGIYPTFDLAQRAKKSRRR